MFDVITLALFGTILHIFYDFPLNENEMKMPPSPIFTASAAAVTLT